MTTHDVGAGAPPRAQVATPLELPDAGLPRPPAGGALFSRAIGVGCVLLAIFLLDRLAGLAMTYWLLESVGYESIFWTNFRMGLLLYAVAAPVFALAVILPFLRHDVGRTVRRRAIAIGVAAGLVAGYVMSGHYLEYLGLREGQDFGQTDPVFGRDIGFYVFDLPAIQITASALVVAALVLLGACAVAALLDRGARDRAPSGRIRGPAHRLGTPGVLVAIALVGATGAIDLWLRRYDLLVKDNYSSSIPTGAEALDVTGVLSTLHSYTVDAIGLLILAASAIGLLWMVRRPPPVESPLARFSPTGTRRVVLLLIPGLVLALGFRTLVEIREQTSITPNEPVAQLPFIQRHIDATNAAFGLDRVEVRDFTPAAVGDPAPDVDALLASPTLRNAPLWPGYISKFERLLDPQYVDRILLAKGDPQIYTPTIDVFRAQEKLRPYYDFMDVDTTRYTVGGEPRLFATSVRELPLIEPQPWLTWWGQRFIVFTHGYGLVGASLSEATTLGDPVYAARGIPFDGDVPALQRGNQRVYYGEGSATLAFSNVTGVEEHDFPTDQGRAQYSYPDDVQAGVRLDSFLKRLVVGWKSRSLLDITFSDIVTDKTRVHYERMPLERVAGVAPFLHLDSDPYAVADGESLTWMVNGMTTTDRYPYSAYADLGDKSDRRSPTPADVRRVNYVADSVKATVDAYTGRVRLYQFADEPVVNTWAAIYPALFQPASEMPAALREQVQYPVQLMHVQFDDLFIYYHQRDALTYFSQEDAFDDADEVVGPILSEGEAIHFSIEPYYWIAETGGALPASDAPTQFALSTVFTPEGAKNLRSIVTAYMDGGDYGRITMLQVPKGRFFPGPEQADAAIDQDTDIAQQIGLWNRRGLEVIRGHTTPLVVKGEVIYVEPLFLRSRQSPIPQLKRVSVVLRGQVAMGATLEQALRAAATKLAAGASPTTPAAR